MSPPPSPFNVDLIKEAAQRERIAKERNVVENEGSMPRDVLNPWNILYAEGQGWTLWFQTEFKLRVVAFQKNLGLNLVYHPPCERGEQV